MLSLPRLIRRIDSKKIKIKKSRAEKASYENVVVPLYQDLLGICLLSSSGMPYIQPHRQLNAASHVQATTKCTLVGLGHSSRYMYW